MNKMKDSTQESIDAYIERGRPLGGFLTAVMANDMHEAFSRADDDNLQAMHEIVKYIDQHVPIGARGNMSSVQKWIRQGGWQDS